jgi:DNA modification methylase
VIHLKVGGGVMGSRCHENEAPFPEKLAEWFIRSFCPPEGIILDPFAGSGTTAAVAKQFGRRFVASDLRWSQCELTKRRISEVQLELYQ